MIFVQRFLYQYKISHMIYTFKKLAHMDNFFVYFFQFIYYHYPNILYVCIFGHMLIHMLEYYFVLFYFHMKFECRFPISLNTQILLLQPYLLCLDKKKISDFKQFLFKCSLVHINVNVSKCILHNVEMYD